MKLIRLLIILLIVISISLISSARTCDELIKDTTIALENNFLGFKTVKETIISKHITEVEVLNDIKKISEPKDINTIILARAHIYYENKEFSKAEDFLEKAINELKYNNKLSVADKSEMIKELSTTLNKYGDTKVKYLVESWGPEWSPINEFTIKSDYHITIGKEINFVKDKQVIGKVFAKRMISNEIFELSSSFAYDAGKEIIPIVDDLEYVTRKINKAKGKNIAIFSRDLDNPNIEYLRIGKTRFRRVKGHVECIENCK